jgi:hypothetical protein
MNLKKNFRPDLISAKREKMYYLQVKGKACIVTDLEEINNIHD